MVENAIIDLGGLALRASALLGLAASILWVFRARAASLRHLLWTTTFLLLLVLPMAMLALPPLEWASWPFTSSSASAASPAAAQAPSLGVGRDLGDPSGRDEPTEPTEPTEPGEGDAEEDGGDEAFDWNGPQIQLGYEYWKLADGYGGGDTHLGWIEIFIHWPIRMLRTSVLAEMGGRDFSLAGDDFVARAAISVGFQLTDYLDPFVPHVAVLGTGGAIVGTRFDTTIAYAFGGAGIELGASLRIVRNLHATMSFSYMRLEMDGAAFDLFAFRAGLGL